MVQINARLVSVIDGDTAILRYIKPSTGAEAEYKVRLLLVNTPETEKKDVNGNLISKAKPYATKAKNFLESSLKTASANNTLRIEYDEHLSMADSKDDFGRELVYVHANGVNMNTQLIQQGLGRLDMMYADKYMYQEDAEIAQEIALKYNANIWQSSNVFDKPPVLSKEVYSKFARTNPGGQNFQPINNNSNTYPNEKYEFTQSKASPKREYFSGSNVKVYFGDVWVDELTEISFSLQEQVAPIYGFHSYTFDRVSRGNRMVQGTFTINFTENGYLKTILKRISDNMIKYRMKNVQKTPSKELLLKTNYTAETIKDLLNISDVDVYNEQIEALKDSFWGKQDYSASSIVPWKDNDTFYYTQRGSMNNLLKENGFNILIDFSPDANTRDFEDCINNINKKGSLFTTYRNIIGVHIGSEVQQITNNGQVVSITYQFIARDLDGDITKTSLNQLF